MREVNLSETKITKGGFWVIQFHNGEYFQDMKAWGVVITTREFKQAHKFFTYENDGCNYAHKLANDLNANLLLYSFKEEQ